MLSSTHRLTGTAAGLTLATVLQAGPGYAAMMAGIATLTAAGVTSPDIDQRGGWRLVDRLLPDELAGHAGPLRHRGVTHWWGLPVIVGYLVRPTVPQQWRWLTAAALIGWCSHLVGDFVFGKANTRQGRGPGIPLAPWWWHIGIGLDTGGTLEAVIRRIGLPIVLTWQVLALLH